MVTIERMSTEFLVNALGLSLGVLVCLGVIWLIYQWISRKEKEVPEVEPLKVGSIYTLKRDVGNPFNDTYAEVLELRDGFVKYRYWYLLQNKWSKGNPTSRDEQGFRECYVEENNPFLKEKMK